MAKKQQTPTPAERKFEEWHDFPPGEKVPVALKPLSKELVVLGYVREVVYYSDKQGRGHYKAYVHEFGTSDRKNLPLLVHDVTNNLLIIMGGKFKVTARGIVS